MEINLKFDEYKPMIPFWKRLPRCDTCEYLWEAHGFRCAIPPHNQEGGLISDDL